MGSNTTTTYDHKKIQCLRNAIYKSATAKTGYSGLLKQPPLTQLELVHPITNRVYSLAPINIPERKVELIPWIREAIDKHKTMEFPLLTVATHTIETYRGQGYDRQGAIKTAARVIAPVIETKTDLYKIRASIHDGMITNAIYQSHRTVYQKTHDQQAVPATQ